MATQTGKQVSGWQCINNTTVYSIGPWSDYLEAWKSYRQYLADYYFELRDTIETAPAPPELEEPLKGLRIMKCEVKEHAELNKSPVESGFRVSDNKTKMPRRIVITGICDNLRGELKTEKDMIINDTRSNFDSGVPLVGGAINRVVNGVTDAVMGYDFETQQQILTTARRVYEKIDDMYRKVSSDSDESVPKMYTISTKGMVYDHMILADVEQLTDAEHLLTIPVTLIFEELIIAGKPSAYPMQAQDAEFSMGGSLKVGNLAEETWNSVKSAVSNWQVKIA